MRVRSPLIGLGALLASTVALPVLAAPASYVLDAPHVSTAFIINHLGYSNMIGRFNDVTGAVQFDKDAVQTATVKVVIKSGSVDTNFAKRDEHLRSPDFFNAKEFPEITFVSSKVEKTGDKTGKLVGDLTMLGVTKPVTLDVVFNKQADNPMSKKDTLGFSARGKIKRTDFGMKYGTPNIGDEVELLIEAEAIAK